MTQSDYIFPLDFKIDPVEKLNFTNGPLVQLVEQFKINKADITHVGNQTDNHFKHTINNINELLSSINLVVYKATMFMSSGNIIGKNIHCDGMVDQSGTIAMLEARINLYEMSFGASSIEWWDSLPNSIPIDNNDDAWWKIPKLIQNPNGSHPFVICLPPFRHDLRSGKLNWNQIPVPNFGIKITSPSAFVRTNIPHHIMQEGGIRVTLSLSIAFQTGKLEGVWEHIQNNIHLLKL